MGKIVRLQHVDHVQPKRVEFFYDGLAIAENGLISIDSDQMNHIKAAYFRGYQNTPEGRRLSGFPELEEYVNEIAKSTEESHVEGDDIRGQPKDNNRVRSRQRDSGQKVS